MAVAMVVLMLMMAFAAVLGAAGQMFMTKGATGVLTVKGLLTNLWLWGFVVSYGVATSINFFVYRLGGKPSIMYPVIATSYIWTIVFASVFLGEPFSAGKIVGSVIVVAGVVCIAVF